MVRLLGEKCHSSHEGESLHEVLELIDLVQLALCQTPARELGKSSFHFYIIERWRAGHGGNRAAFALIATPRPFLLATHLERVTTTAVRKYLVELIGTFALVFIAGCCVLNGAGSLAPLAVGLGLAGVIYAGGHVSGAHYNPAVTLAVWLRGKCGTSDVLPYIVSQVLGAVLAALAVKYLHGAKEAVAGGDLSKIFLAEVLGTLALVWVILNVSTTTANEGNSFYGAAIGAATTGLSYALSGVSGAVFNPALAVGGWMLGLYHGSLLWIYPVACCLGAAIASQIFKFTKDSAD
jgi:aquaporin Z